MRTTMTLEPDVVTKLNRYMQKTGKSAKEAYNELLRAALSGAFTPPASSRHPFKPILFKGKKGLQSGFSWDLSTAQILDTLDEMAWKSR